VITSMRTLVTGGQGLLARHVAAALRGQGHAVTIVSRRPAEVRGRAVDWAGVRDAMSEVDAVVNLAGASLTHRRWHAERKHEILESRVDCTNRLVAAIAAARPRPTVLVNASATAVYGPRADAPLDETTSPGDGFVAEVYRRWEAAAVGARALGVRVVLLRFGVVLASDGGVLPRLLPLYRAGLGGPLGRGTQWMSWIHRDDAVALVLAALVDAGWEGPLNAVTPSAVRQRDFARTLARAVHRPAVVRVPGLALRVALGEMATLLLGGQRAVPAALTAAGYSFRYPDLETALAESVGGDGRAAMPAPPGIR